MSLRNGKHRGNGTAAPISPFVNGAAIDAAVEAEIDDFLASDDDGLADAPAPPPVTAGRGADGKFVRGCKPGPGNPHARAVAARRQALLAAVTPGDVAAVGKALLAQALASDVPSAKVLLQYAVGKPAEAGDPDRLDLEQFLLARTWPSKAEACLTLLNAVDPADALELLERALAGHDGAHGRLYRSEKPDPLLAKDVARIGDADLAAKGGRGA